MAWDAKAEAEKRRRMNCGLNFDDTTEFAYSPSTGALGIRNFDTDEYRVFNVNYPMYGRSSEVSDWVSVGVVTSKKKARGT